MALDQIAAALYLFFSTIPSEDRKSLFRIMLGPRVLGDSREKP